MKGRPRKPRAIKIAEGNLGKRPMNKNEPQPRAIAGDEIEKFLATLTIPEIPDWRSAEATREWVEKVETAAHKQFLGMFGRTPGLLTEIDMPLLDMCAAHWALWRKAYEEAKGANSWHPATGEMRRQSGLLKSMFAEFGCGPATRARMTISNAASDPLGDLDD